MSSTDPIRVIHSSKSNLELIHSANTVNYRSTPTIKLSHISSARYRPRVTRIRRTRRQPIHYENSWKQGISQLKKIPRSLSSPYHRRITPISQRELVPVDAFMNFDGQTTKPKHKWMNSIKRISIPTFIRNSNILRELSESNGKKDESTTSTTSTSTTTTTSTSTTSSTSTSSTSTTSSTSSTTSTTTSTSATTSTASTTTTITVLMGTVSVPHLFSTSGTTPSYWNEYSFNFVAATTAPILIFSFTTNLNSNYFLDAVSVALITLPSVQLLENPSFENSTTIATDWLVWCAYTCTGGAGAQVTWGTNCYLSIGNCFLVDCPDTGSGAIVYLGQSFSATIGSTYKIDFWLRMAYAGGSTSSSLFNAFVQ
ncbi:unnamed protein product [Rotaria magnacalcarata]|uniref:Uncharacterized protein n=1 Tax=Rotaria magnacalcarata TaxID=392030 RepID=A0A816QU07_9BILA|nr:unnamed protein product [Rotaria magnacalcarata]